MIPAYYSFIDPERIKGWVGLVGWPVAVSLPALVVTHQLQVERRTGKVRQSETDVLPLCHATNYVRSGCWMSIILHSHDSLLSQQLLRSRVIAECRWLFRSSLCCEWSGIIGQCAFCNASKYHWHWLRKCHLFLAAKELCMYWMLSCYRSRCNSTYCCVFKIYVNWLVELSVLTYTF